MERFKGEIAKLQEQLADLEDRREEASLSGDEARAEIEGIDSWLESNRQVVRLTELVPVAKGAEGEMAYITKGQYRKHWGREPKQGILTADGRRVRWEYALDELAQQLGLEKKYGPNADEALRNLIHLARSYKKRRVNLMKDLSGIHEDVQKVEGKMESVSVGLGRREQVVDVQEERSPRAIATDNAKLARTIVPLRNVHKWLNHPEKFDIRGVDTPSVRKRKRVMPRVSSIRKS